MRFYSTIAAMTVTGALACASAGPRIPNPKWGAGEPGPIQRIYESAHPDEPTGYVNCDAWPASGVTEIGIERTPCYGLCPTYTFVVRSDGTAEYRGQANVEHIGKRKGRLRPEQVEEIFRLAIDIGFFELADFYGCAITDNETVFLTAVRGGQRKTIQHYAPDHCGPPRLRWLELTLDLLEEAVEWQ